MGAEGVRTIIVLSLRQKNREAMALMKTLTPEHTCFGVFFCQN